MILVTGAAGKTGTAVIKSLARRGTVVRALVRRPHQVEAVKVLGARDAAVGDMADPQAFRQALDGVSAVYHICPNMHPDEITIGRAVIDASRQAGLHHFVYHSVLHPQIEKMPHHWHKLRVEEMLFESGLNFTILQPAAYMQNVLASRDSIFKAGIYSVPYPVSTRMSLVDLKDAAEAAAVVLTEPGHMGAVYELAGPEVLSQADIANALSEVCGPVRAAQQPIDDWRAQAQKSGLGQYQVETLVKMFDYYARFHFEANGNVLRWLLGRPPTAFGAFASREFR
jgi:NAD(P)H dehydrogenase (quinone)